MPIYDPVGRYQVCSKCGWKNPMVEHSDCLQFYYAECPRCKSELHWQKANSIQHKIESFMKLFKR